MNILIAIVGSIVAIFGIIILHELGHFVVARLCSIKILRFSIGFGKAIYKWTGKRGTEYILAILPLGGYVKMLGEGDEVTTPEDAHQAFNQKPVLTRMAVVVAGPLVNFLLAIIAFWGVYFIGVSHTKLVIGEVIPHSIAAKAGVESGDQVLSIDGVKMPNWERAVMAVITHLGGRDTMTLTVKPAKSDQATNRVLNLSAWRIDRRNPDFFKSLGFYPYQPKIPAVIARIDENSPAAKAGLAPGDVILAINGQSVNDWENILSLVRTKPGKQIILTIQRQNKRLQQPVLVGSVQQGSKQIGHLGILSQSPVWPASMIEHAQYTALTAWVPAMEQTWMLTRFNFIVVVKMISGKISVHALGGPITVFQAAGKASQAGWQVYLGFIGFISLTIGFINLLPIPGLDGGHVLFQVIEGIFRRPVPERIQMIGLSIGMIFLIFLMVQATINDVIRLFVGT